MSICAQRVPEISRPQEQDRHTDGWTNRKPHWRWCGGMKSKNSHVCLFTLKLLNNLPPVGSGSCQVFHWLHKLNVWNTNSPNYRMCVYKHKQKKRSVVNYEERCALTAPGLKGQRKSVLLKGTSAVVVSKENNAPHWYLVFSTVFNTDRINTTQSED